MRIRQRPSNVTDPPLQNPANMTIATLFAAAASTAPTPGGGSVTAICGYLGVSLLLKSIRVSARRQPDAIYATFEDKLLKLATQLLAAAQADSDAFAQYIRAMQLPKTTSPEQTARQSAMNEASIAATESALDILDLGNEVLDCAHQLQDRVIPAIRADARACIELISAMNIIARENALSNLAGADSSAGSSVDRFDALRHRLNQAVDRYEKLIASCQRPQ
jgi:methenyltetrahydrofolate cyclohydrolase